ncbi:hypothetical protein ACGFZL_20750 [Streptomyces sp. NPDC048182]|uniref:hypothetical protein n=1 Tax=Streptomyces sp. NPDC048182 TaxID=3365507 RepID=UPI003715E76E
MPRPTAAQYAYGSCTVLLSTLAMLLLSRTSSGPGVAVVAVAALGLGLLVAMTVPQPRARRTRTVASGGRLTPAEPPVRARAAASRVPADAGERVRGRAA